MAVREKIRFALFALLAFSTVPLLAATRTWTGAVDNHWSVAGNWSGGVAPVAGDDLMFPTAAANKSTLNDYPAWTTFHQLVVGNGYTLAGNGVVLSFGISNIGNNDVYNVALGVRIAPMTSAMIAAPIFSGTLDVNGAFVSFFGDLQGTVAGSGTMVLQDAQFTGSGTFSGTFIVGMGVAASPEPRFDANYPAATLSPENHNSVVLRNATVGTVRFGWGGLVTFEGVVHAGSTNCAGYPYPGESRPTENTFLVVRVLNPGDIAGRLEVTGTADLRCTNLEYADDSAPLNAANVMIHAAGGLIGESPSTPAGAWRSYAMTYPWFYPYTSTTVSAIRKPWPGNFHDMNSQLSDVLWHNDADRNNALWIFAADGSVQSIVNLGRIPDPAWHPAGVNDFDGDGVSDILWHNDSSGNNAIWVMHGLASYDIVNLPWLPTGYRVEATGDLDSDGSPDIVVHNATTGALALWLMNGTAFREIANLPPITNPNERVVGVIPYQDPNVGEDGFYDLLLRDLSNGKQRLWLMRHLVKIGGVPYPSVEVAAYHVAAVGRFTDGQTAFYPAFVVRNPSSGANAVTGGPISRTLPPIFIPTLDGYGPR